MALHKRDRFSFRWSKSELPDNDDINTQVLLLGITRFETTPSPVPSIKLLATDTKQIYESYEQLNKTITGCFSLDRPKSKLRPLTATHNNNNNNNNHSSLSSSTNVTNGCAVVNNAINPSSEPHNTRLIEPISHRNHFDRLFERFQSKEIPTKLGVNDTQHCISIEHKTFHRWLSLNRTKKRADKTNVKCLNDANDQWQSLHTPVIRKCSTKSNSIRRKATKKSITKSGAAGVVTAAGAVASTSNNTSRFSSCIPYCVTAVRSRTNSVAGHSLASSHRYAEYCNKKRSGATQATSTVSTTNDQHRHRLPTSNDCLMHSYCESNKHFIPSNKHTDTTQNNNCSLFNNLNIMDRSVDSIGSCSLDVDAESTDFSDTSGSLNVCTPSSGKDFTREFTSRIHERCQFPNAHQTNNQQQKLQQTKTVLDPNSGKISTIISQNVPTVIQSPTSPVKKPSYLNLACCVNGYSNLTTYDSKFRQSINKSREVSPIRPITYSVQYNRNGGGGGGGDNNYLSIPIAVPINDNNKHHMMDAHTILSPEKRFYSTQTQQKTIEINGTNHDVTDNVNSNGCAKFFARSMLHTTTATTTTSTTTNGVGNTSLALVRDVNQEFDANSKGTSKSFIQQRVERLYGPTAVTQGLYSPKKPKTADDNHDTTTRTTISSVLVEKSQNSSNTTFQSTKYVLEAQRNGHLNNSTNSRSSSAHDDENINLNSLNEALPVLRHLRPEFRAQLPTLSPKRTVAISKLTNSSLNTTSSPVVADAILPATAHTQSYSNGTSINGKLNISTSILNKPVTNGSNGSSVGISSGGSDDDVVPLLKADSNRCTLDVQSHKHQSSVFNAPNATTKNGCLTSNKSHDIENDCRHNQIKSPLNGRNLAESHVDTRITPKNCVNILPTNDKQDINTIEMTNDMSESTKGIETSNSINVMSNNSTVVNASGDATKFTTPMAETMDANGNHKTDQKKDAHYYLNTVKAERDRLIDMAINTEKELDQLLQKGGVDEEVLGHLRSAAGKARLLATKKFKQFEGLCDDCINQTVGDMPPPTPDDLQGFWEMVYLQVENVDSLFVELDKIRANDWQKPTQEKPKQPQGAKLTKRPASAPKVSATGAAKKSATAIAAAEKREAQRKQLMEMRRKHKMAMTSATNSPNDNLIVDSTPETTANQSNNEVNSGENETDR